MQANWRDAATSGNVAVLDRLLDEGIDIDCRDRYGQTALMLAAVHGRDDAVRCLLDHAADPDVTAKYSLSAMMLAIINGHCRIARMLFEAGADPSIKGTGAPGFANKPAYDLAVEGRHLALARLMSR